MRASTGIENCPFFTNKSCRVCIDRCPAGAITAEGHNMVLCESYEHEHIGHLRQWYGVQRFGCGLCQGGVPCESCIPPTAAREIRNRFVIGRVDCLIELQVRRKCPNDH